MISKSISFKFENNNRLSVGTILIVFILLLSNPKRIIAQGGRWEGPINISDDFNESFYPSIVADRSGVVHVVWAEDQFGATGGIQINYARYDGEIRTQAVDIILSPNSTEATTPVLASDHQGYLHLVWEGTGQVFYSQAWAADAHSARGWQNPVMLTETIDNNASAPDIAVDQGGIIHLTFAVPVGKESGIYYMRSNDNGYSWSSPSVVYLNNFSDKKVDNARLSADRSGSIHIVWTEYNFPETYPPLGIRYSKSLDNGLSWTPVYKINGPYDFSGITTTKEGQVHLVWSGTIPDRRKFHQWTADQGKTWSVPVITIDVGGFQGWPGLVSDSLGNLHLVQVSNVGNAPETLTHQTWNGKHWSKPIALLQRPENAPTHPKNPDIAIGLGNELHIVVQQIVQKESGKWVLDILYFHGYTGAPGQEPESVKITGTPQLTIDKNQSVSNGEENTGTPSQAFSLSGQNETASSIHPMANLYSGFIPVMIVIGGVVFYQMLKRHRG
jgi:hypothetical protein